MLFNPKMLFDPRSVPVISDHLINGSLFSSDKGKILDVFSASDLSLSWPLPIADEEVVDMAVSSAKTAFKSSGWAGMAPRDRAKILHKWAGLIRKNVDEIAQLESLVSTRHYNETIARDVYVAADCISFFAEYADKVEGHVTATSSDILSLSVREPHGVVAAISPWNFPLILSAWKYAPALAAGNAVVLKPSELTPFSVLKIAELAVEAGLPPGIFNVIQGTGAITGEALTRHPDVDYVTFTGSTETGIEVACTATRSGLKPFSLELGGKGAQVVFADAPNLDDAVKMVARGVCYNGGQVCFAGSRLIVQSDISDAFIDKLKQEMGRLRPGPTWDARATLAPVMNERQLKRIKSIIAESISQGAQIIHGGNELDTEFGGVFFEPTILGNVTSGTAAVDCEIFGPVLTLQTFDDFDEAVELANHRDYALASSVHTCDINKALNAARMIEAGTIWVNDWGRKADLTSPFGGFKRSGQGKDLGRLGFEKYLKSKSVWIATLPV